MTNLIFPNDIPSKANPTTSDILLIADQADNSELKKITIGDITTDIGAGLIVDGSESLTTTYSSTKINDLNDAQDTTISSNYSTLNTNKLNRTGQLRLGNGAWKTTYNDGSGNEVELTLGASGKVLQSNGATSAPTWEAPSVDINGQTEDIAGDMDNDYSLVYDASAGANRKQKVNVFRATDAEVTTGSSTTKFVTPAQLHTRARKIYVDVVPTGTSIGGTLTTLYTTTISANTFTADSEMVVKISIRYGNAGSGTGTVNVKFGGVTVYTDNAVNLTGAANTPYELEVRLSFDATTGVCNMSYIRVGSTTIASGQSFNLSTASLTSNQTFTIDAIRTGSGGEFSYYTSSMIKI